MNESQKKSWDCLLEIEKKSLFLQLSNGKSSWEAGGILKIAHYKYLEIRERSEKFFRMFSDYFEKHESIFRPYSPCEQSFIDYIEGVIEKRMSRKEAAAYTGDSSNLIHKVRVKMITRNINYLKDSEDPWDKDTLALIREFDRWNNFRVLPKMLQQPSAYKRRANKKDKIYIKYLLERVPTWIHQKLIERFRYKVNRPGIKKYWVCLVSDELYPEEGYLLLPVRPNEESITEMSRFYIYIFEDKEDADTFGFMVSKFMDKTSEVKLGQKFWPEYRYVVQKAVNYNQVNNIDFNVKSLDMAYNVHKPQPKPKKKKVVSDAQPRAKSSEFYK